MLGFVFFVGFVCFVLFSPPLPPPKKKDSLVAFLLPAWHFHLTRRNAAAERGSPVSTQEET